MKNLMLALASVLSVSVCRAERTTADYVQKGLVSFWDAIDNQGTGSHDATASSWKDLKGSNDLTLGNAGSWTDGSALLCECDKKNTYAAVRANSTPASTIDIAFESKRTGSNGWVFSNGAGRYMALATGRVQWSDGYGITSFSFNNLGKHTLTWVDNAAAYLDGEDAGFGTYVDTWGYVADQTVIGYRETGVNQAYNGLVHAIRLYDRALTPVEVAWNAAVDQVRFMNQTEDDVAVFSRYRHKPDDSFEARVWVNGVRTDIQVDGAAAASPFENWGSEARTYVLTACPKAGMTFLGWSGDVDFITSGSAIDTTITVTVPASQAVDLTATSSDGASYDELLQYVTLGPGAYVDTGYKPANSPKVQVKFSYTLSNTGNSFDIFGTKTAKPGCYILDVQYASFYYRYGTKDHNGQVSGCQPNAVFDVTADSSLVVNGVTRQSSLGGTVADVGETVCIPGLRYSNVPDTLTVYSFQMWDGGEPVRDLVPCLISGNVGFYDRCSKQVLPLAGTKKVLGVGPALHEGGTPVVFEATRSLTGGIDLARAGYIDDAMVLKGGLEGVTIAGPVVVADDLTPEHPFALTNRSEGVFVLDNSNLLGAVPLSLVSFSGYPLYFANQTLKVDDAQDADWFRQDGSALQVDNLSVGASSAVHPASFVFNQPVFNVRRKTSVGANGSFGTVTVASGKAGGRDNSTKDALLGDRGDSSLRLACYDAAPEDSMRTGHAEFVQNGGEWNAWQVFCGQNNPAGADVTNQVLRLNGGTFRILDLYKYGSAPLVIYKKSANSFTSHGWGDFLTFCENATGDIVFDGCGEMNLDVYFNRYSYFARWRTGATGKVVFRNTRDVTLWAGDNDIETGGAHYENPDGDKYVWDMTGDLVFKGGSSTHRIHLEGDNIFPHGAKNGGVVVMPSFRWMNFAGTRQACNSLTGGGTLTNSADRAAEIEIGANDVDGVFDAVIAPNSLFKISKLGTGELSVYRSIPELSAQGSVRVKKTAGVDRVDIGTLTLAANTPLAIEGQLCRLDVHSLNGNVLGLVNGGTLEIGGDGADETIDLSQLTGDIASRLRKVGANKVTLTGVSSAFNAMLAVEKGTLAVGADATLGNNLGGVTVASGATIHVPAGKKIRTFGYANDGTKTGEGTIEVVADSGNWTGAVDDNPETAGNWEGLAESPDVTSGAFTGVFARDNNGKVDLEKAIAFRGISFGAEMTGFSFAGVDPAAELVLRAGGLALDACNREADNAFVLNISAPVRLPAEQTWTFGSNATVSVTGSLSPLVMLTKNGAGKLEVNGSNATGAGVIYINDGVLKVAGDNPVGAGAITVMGGKQSMGRAQIHLAGATLYNDITVDQKGSWDERTVWNVASGTTNVIHGAVNVSVIDNMEVPRSSCVVFDGGYTCNYANWRTSGGGTVMVTNGILNLTGGTFEGHCSNLILCEPNNYIKNMGAYAGSCATLGLDLRADYALNSPDLELRMKNDLKLNGHDQQIGSLCMDASTAVIASAGGTAALLKINQTKNYPVKATVRDGVSIEKGGPGELVLSAVNSSTGTVAVLGGTLVFTNDASWAAAPSVTVANGAAIKVGSRHVFGKQVDLFLSGTAQYRFDTGVTGNQRVRWIYRNGEQLPMGVYGAKGSAAPNKVEWITGGGCLKVLGTGPGMYIRLR